MDGFKSNAMSTGGSPGKKNFNEGHPGSNSPFGGPIKSRLEQKIEIVQQIMTMLEAAMSTAKSIHKETETNYLSKIKALQLEIEKLRQEMEQREKYFEKLTETLEGDIQKYMALDNILLTIEEGSKDDNEAMLPDLSNSDSFVTEYLMGKEIEWHNLKLQRLKLNHETEHALMPNVRVRKFRLVIAKEPSAEEQLQLRKVTETATFLNLHRGKKLVSKGTFSAIVRDVTLTWFMNQPSAAEYVETHYQQIIQDVVGKEYVDRNIDITEVDTNAVSGAIGDSLTIHVQGKAQSESGHTPVMPRTITLYQFDETPYVPPGLTTFNIQTASPVDKVATSKSSTALSPPKKSNTPDLLSVFGINDSVVEVPPVPRSAEKRCQMPNNSVKNDKNVKQSSKDQAPSAKLSLPPLSSPSSNVLIDNIVETDSDVDKLCVRKEFDGVKLREWVWAFVQKTGIESFTDSQKRFLNSLHQPGDIHYRGVADGGKTTCTVIGVLDNINSEDYAVQSLIITPNSRSSKLVQKLVSVEEREHVIICQRVEELMSTSKHDHTNSTKMPNCHVLVGTCDQMKDVVRRNRLDPDKVTFLVLDKADEIFAAGKASDILKIVYSLNASVKVIVTCRSTTACSELEQFCRTKLRRTLVLEETLVPAALKKLRVQHRSDESVSGSSAVSLENLAKSTHGSGAIVHQRKQSVDSSKPSEAESENETGESSSSEVVRLDAAEPERSWTTFIPKSTLIFLGIETSDVPANELLNLENVSHLYATLDGDDFKVEIISQLDIEEDKTIIFCDTIERTEWLSTKLRQQRLWPQVLHDDTPRKEQKMILQNYKQGSCCRVLISTDFLTSISLDVADVVLNFDLPKSRTEYINRSAFATRNGSMDDLTCYPEVDRKRVVVSLINENEHELLANLEEALGITIEPAYKDD